MSDTSIGLFLRQGVGRVVILPHCMLCVLVNDNPKGLFSCEGALAWAVIA